ncbi:helix-hairpin-helix domain-containing protein [Bacillus sp. ISL-47]|uniref:helix-hairpin-helix domain-containing protein n=1 Tax=Bacillus sp. ISL-47 TaxID=2819130 RepID=UPI001BE709C3|nr:helix-hairpin-helix domain-containing protein [Bacillus sp. ISL-47]MBT2690293.1 helix-hairpin-helix domain-containing protein [Bacillus sp. ISL-47]
MAEWVKSNKAYFLGGAFAICAFLYYLFMPPQETKPLPDIDPVQIADREESVHDGTEDKVSANGQPQVIIVDLKGAVKKPGVYETLEGDRVIDVLEKAGGLLENADRNQINLALRVADEMAIYIPEKGEGVLEMNGDEGMASISVQQNDGKINLNKASEAELQTLPGIGPSKAAAILEHRETNGAFKAIEDLKLIAGIGEKTFEKLKEQIKVK